MTNGSSSRFPLSRLASKYVEQTNDGRFLSNRHSLEIVRARIMQLFERIDANDAPDRLSILEKLWEKYKAQKDAGLSVEAVMTAAEIDTAFAAARTDFAVWNQMLQLLDLDRKMVESEVKIAKEIKAIMTAEEVYEMIAKVMAAIFSAVNSMNTISLHDKGLLMKRIQYDFTRITGDGITVEDGGEETDAGTGAGVGETIDL